VDVDETPLEPPVRPTQRAVQPVGPIDVGGPPNGPEPTVDFDPVVVQQPRLRVDGVDVAGRDVIGELLAVEGVSWATAITLGTVALRPEGAESPHPLRVAVVDPAGFRVLTPQVTADAVEVWQRIVEGDAAFTHDVAHNLGLDLGERVPVGGGTDVRVGAYASNGIPPVAEAVVTAATAERIGLREAGRTLLVAVRDDVSPAAVAEQITDIVGGEPSEISEPQQRRAFLSGNATRDAFEPFTYVSIGDGMIQIDPAWVRRNIVRAEVPIFSGQVVCHRLMIQQLRGALQEIVDRGLDHLVDPTQYGGCWVPRHILFNPNRALSMHAWGLAIDFNVAGNEYGNQNPAMDPRIVEIFQRWGFNWGGHWRIRDGMHFELAALMQ
jgi:hypothetical protein